MRTLLEKQIKTLVKDCEERVILKLNVEFNKFNTYDETSIVAPLYIHTIDSDGILVANEMGDEEDEYHLYELTTDSLLNVLNALKDLRSLADAKITFIFEDSESGARPFIHFLVDSGILDIHSNFLNNIVSDYQVEVSYWIDTMGISIEESVDLGIEELKNLGFTPLKVLVNGTEWNN